MRVLNISGYCLGGQAIQEWMHLIISAARLDRSDEDVDRITGG